MEIFGIFIIIYFGVIVLMVVSFWKLYERANKPGWASIVPIYNVIVMLEIVKKPIWWIALLFIPIANIVIIILIMIEFAKAFGKESSFAVGLIFLPAIFIPILAFSDAKYMGGHNDLPVNMDVLDL